MATAPSYVEQQAIPQEKSLMENLMDFSLQQMMTPRMLKMLYCLHLLRGLIVVTGIVHVEFVASTSRGLLALILGVAALFFWTLYCRIIVEVLAVVFRVGNAVTNSNN